MRKQIKATIATSLLALFLISSTAVAQPSYELIDTILTVDTIDQAPMEASDLALSPDGSRIYSLSLVSPPPHTSIEILLMVSDTATRQVVDVISLGLGGSGIGIGITPDGEQVYVPLRGLLNDSHPQRTTPLVAVFDTLDNSVTSIHTGGSIYGPMEAVATPDGTRVYVADLDPGVIRLIDTSTKEIIQNIPVSSRALSAIAITPDGSRVYAADRRNGDVVVVDTATNSQVATIGTSLPGSVGRHQVEISPDGTRAYTTQNVSVNLVSVIDIDPSSAFYHTEIASIPTTADNIAGIAVAGDNRALFLASTNSNEVLIVDTDPTSATFHTQIGIVPVPDGSPRYLATNNATEGLVYVTLPGSNSIGVIGIPLY